MAPLEIVKAWDADGAILRRPAQRVRTFDATLHRLLDEMVETMRAAPGVGLAAPQVGVGLRVAVIEYAEDEEEAQQSLRLYELVNPEIIKSKGSEMGEEGCLSLPGLAADVERATFVLVKAQDRYGNLTRIKAYGWLARIFQHEIDHLQGVLMTERTQQLYRLQQGEDGTIEMIPIDAAQFGPLSLVESSQPG